MRTIIAGSRDLAGHNPHPAALERCYLACCEFIDIFHKQNPITTVLCGYARGPDIFGRHWAVQHGVAVADYPADWEHYGRSAGVIRNTLMARNADALIAFWNGVSVGTKHMIDTAHKRGLLVVVHTLDAEIEELL